MGALCKSWALGVMGTFDARTSIIADNGAPLSPVLGQAGAGVPS